ncbi:hypothetical protein [Brevibacillus gelatini]|uniref:hypothetical protein n=1 Tax=Brevibacillus gelatini TaxID=1655277 RepID=UPI0011CE47C5|nr:hypothetical protein [Brevibacillus gelatini]
MATSYGLIFDKFIKKIKNDTDFFNYSGLSESDIELLVNEHLNSLLDRAVDFIYRYGVPDVDFLDRDDSLQQFNVELVNQEITLLADIMYFSYVEEERNKIKSFSITFRSDELNVFSPANERKTVLRMIESLEASVVNSIQNYLARDRHTWKYKSIYNGEINI